MRSPRFSVSLSHTQPKKIQTPSGRVLRQESWNEKSEYNQYTGSKIAAARVLQEEAGLQIRIKELWELKHMTSAA